MKEVPERRYDLDWLRVIAVLLLIYFHTAAIFYRGDLGEFYVVNDVTNGGMGIFIAWIHQWHMPLFFFLSGAGTWFSLESRSVSQYVQERLQRLLIPFVVGILVLVPPQVYWHRLSTQRLQLSYFEFYPQFFDGIRPAGNFEWAHLWFIVYLLVISLIALPGLIAVKYSRVRWSKFRQLPGAIFYPALLLAGIEALLRPRWPGFQNLYDDWANVCLYFTYFVYGYLFGAEPGLGALLDRQRSWVIGGAIATMSVLLGFWLTGTVPERGYSPAYVAYQALRGFTGWCWVLALISLARSCLNFKTPLLQYANEAAYPFYILHQTVVVTIGFYVVQWQTGIPEKFIVISTTALLGTLGLYELLVRRLDPLRFCFGLKPRHP